MLAVALMLSSCAEKKIDGVDYEINVPNLILSIIFSETIIPLPGDSRER